MRRLEETVMTLIKSKLHILFVKGTFVTAKTEDFENIYDKINNLINGITITIESELNGKLSFLDVLVAGNLPDRFKTSVYSK